MLCRRKLSPRRRRLRKYISLLAAFAVLCTVFFETAVKSRLSGVIVREMCTLSEQAVTAAVGDYLSDHPDAGDRLCEIVYNNGSVAAITTDPAYVNSVKTAVTERAQAYIDELSHTQGVSAHLGSFTGLVSLADIGPVIRLSVDSTQTVSCEFGSSFESAGINQTVHHMTMTVYVDLIVYDPFRIDETVSTSSTFEIAQTVIVGTVPSYSGVVSY